MKKIIIACAAVLALGLASCGNTKACYEVKVMSGEREVYTFYLYETSNDIDAAIDAWKKSPAAAIFGDGLTFRRSILGSLASESDCLSKNK